MKKLISILCLVAVSAFAQFSGGPAPLNNVRLVSTVGQFTNTVIALNAASIDGVKRTIQLAPGTYPLGQSTYRLHVSNNICIRGSGMAQTTITGSGSPDNPMVWLFDNCEIYDLQLYATNKSANPQLGYKAASGRASSTNVTVGRVWLKGDDDNLWVSTVNGAYSSVLTEFQAADWTLFDCLFDNHFDSVYIEANNSVDADLDGDGFNDEAPAVVRIYSSRLVSAGPSTDATSRARGDVTNIRILGMHARCEVYGSYLHSSGGTNTTTAAFISQAAGLYPIRESYKGGLYLNNCQVDIVGTNLSSGGVGACLVQNTNGWVFINAVNSTSNNIVGNGTNFYSADLNRGFADSVSLTADNQAVNPKLSRYIKLSSDNVTAANRTFTIVTGYLKPGDVILLEWTGTNAGELVDDAAMSSGNARLASTWTPTQYDTITLEFNGTDLVERGRSTN